MTKRNWYLIQCKPQACFRAMAHLENQSYEVFLPVLQREALRRGKPALLTEPLFPHYLFVRLSSLEDNWAPLRSTRGVARVVRFGDLPLHVPDHVVLALQQANNEEPRALFSQGDRVQITSGPLHGLSAIFSARDGNERAVLLITLLHQQQTIKLRLSNIRHSD